MDPAEHQAAAEVPPEPKRLAAILRQQVAATDACFDDIARTGGITPANGRAYRAARVAAILAAAQVERTAKTAVGDEPPPSAGMGV